MLQKTNRLTLVEQVAQQMEALIESGHWAVGVKIPAEPELMAELNVSRNTLREAIRALIHAGLLKTRQGDGTYVCSSSALGAVLQRRIARSNALQTIEVRYALEREAAYLAAERRNAEDIAAMQTAFHTCEVAIESGDLVAYIQADMELHQAIVHASHNDILIELYTHILEFTEQSIALISEQEDYEVYGVTHRELLTAIVEQRADDAVQAVHSYIAEAKRAFLREEADFS